MSIFIQFSAKDVEKLLILKDKKMKKVLIVLLALSLIGCAFKLMYGLSFEYEDKDATAETMGDEEAKKE